MTRVLTLIRGLPWSIVIMLCLTLGLAPFFPEPHVWGKLKMLASGTLVRPIDIFDLLMHGAPYLLAAAKLALEREAR